MKYLSKIFEEGWMTIEDDQPVPEGYFEVAYVDYHSASWNTVEYFRNKKTNTTHKVRSFEAIKSFTDDPDYKKATAKQISDYDAENGED